MQGHPVKGIQELLQVDEGAATCTDVLTNVVLSKRSFKAAQGDKSMKVDLDGMAMGGIKINGLDA